MHVVLHVFPLQTALPHDWLDGVTHIPAPSQVGAGVYVLPEHVALPHDCPLARLPQWPLPSHNPVEPQPTVSALPQSWCGSSVAMAGWHKPSGWLVRTAEHA